MTWIGTFFVTEKCGRTLRYISAAELEKYCYCPLSWWLSRSEKAETKIDHKLAEGKKKHENIAETLSEVKTGERRSREYETLILWFAIGATLIALIGLSFLLPFVGLKLSQILAVLALIWLLAATYFMYRASVTRNGTMLTYGKLVAGFAVISMVIAVISIAVLNPEPKISLILECAALLWLVGACFYLQRAITITRKMAELRRKVHIEKGSVTYVDFSADKTDLLVSEKYGLAGRPDAILLIDGNLIPFELKTGRVPRGPLFSHLLQVIAYCLLIEDIYKRTPPYGILQYGDIKHEVEFSEELKQILLQKLKEMRIALETGWVHRNHHRAGKCQHCSRREKCPEKL